MRACFLMESVFGENSILCYTGARWSDVKKGPNIWKTYYHKEDIPGAYTLYTCYSLLTVIVCNLGPGHNNEVVRHEVRYD